MSFSTDALRERFPGLTIRENVPLGKMTTFRCGGNAARFVSPKDAGELSVLLSFLQDADEPYFLLGRGSNILVSDAGFLGTIVSMREHFSEISVSEDGLIRAKVLPEDYDFESHKKLVPMQPGDVPVTYADSEGLEKDYGFTPRIGIREGLRAFAEWYKEYNSKKK